MSLGFDCLLQRMQADPLHVMRDRLQRAALRFGYVGCRMSAAPAPGTLIDYAEVYRAQGARRVESIVRYLDTLKRIAQAHNENSVVRHLEECAAAVLEAFYGRYSLPRRELPYIDSVPISELPGPTVKPRWHIEKYSQPLRRVMERRLKRGCVYFILDCGHELEDITASLDVPCPKRRRCKECRLAAKVVRA